MRVDQSLSHRAGKSVHNDSSTRNQRAHSGDREPAGRQVATAGDLELKIPRLRAGSFFPSLLERRRRVDQSLFAVIMEAYLHGTSIRKVNDLAKALGADGVKHRRAGLRPVMAGTATWLWP